jgi:hypothetical protein
MEFLFGDDLARRGFRPEDAQPAHAVGQEDDRQGQKSHAAQQVRLAAPEKQPVGHHFDVRQNRGAAGGVAGHHLEKGVGERRDGPVDHERQGAQRGNEDPAESGDEDAVFNTQVVVLPEKPPQGRPQVRINAAEIKWRGNPLRRISMNRSSGSAMEMPVTMNRVPKT